MAKPTTTVQVQVAGSTFQVEGYYHPAVAGRFSGPPEDCFPDEPGEFEIERVTFVGDDEETTHIPYQLLEELYVQRKQPGSEAAIYDSFLDALANAAYEAAESEAREFDAAPTPWEEED